MGNLQETKSFIRLRGILTGKDNPSPKSNNGYKEGTTKTGKDYRALRFLVKTSPDNVVPVEIFGMEMDKAYAYNKSLKKTVDMPFAKRLTQKLPDGYELIESDYDKVERINTDFRDGDSICVVGLIQFSEYTNENTGVTSLQTKYVIKDVYMAKNPIDLNADDFKEDAIFEQELVINEIEEDKKENKLLVTGNTIGYGDKVYPAYFEVNIGNVDASFVKNIKTLKHGDFLKVNGIVNYRALQTEVSENDGWGTKVRTATTYYKIPEITGAYEETLERKKYTEDDLVVEKAIEKVSKEKAKKAQQALAEAEQEDISDEELPF